MSPGETERNRCPSVHYWSRSCCQHDRGHDGPHVAEAFGLPRFGYFRWVDGPSGLGFDQRPYVPGGAHVS